MRPDLRRLDRMRPARPMMARAQVQPRSLKSNPVTNEYPFFQILKYQARLPRRLAHQGSLSCRVRRALAPLRRSVGLKENKNAVTRKSDTISETRIIVQKWKQNKFSLTIIVSFKSINERVGLETVNVVVDGGVVVTVSRL